MRNTIKVLMCAILAFAFVGCTEGGGDDNKNRLATPNFSLRAEGNEITLNTGKTYIGFVPDDNWAELVIE